MLGGKEFPAGISDTAGMVYEILLTEPKNEDGLNVKDIAQKSGLLVRDVFEAGDVLLSAGLISTTDDNGTWAVLEQMDSRNVAINEQGSSLHEENRFGLPK